ncbi:MULTISPECIES: hypothetical protein [Paraburkholderia]|uniref:Uncharacterized protein n=1 Tax=Paraburkholderia dioscoreae TaxID=2604047 RepID=A0A5Q4ZHI8_9BURK|nr:MULTISPECIES: hypothetical protein [Paraburkholderia]MDR8399486.1 hypothetical protein [Paraburkholderia sp. USG1]VVD26516.1 conserved protein of unknown function [Paraburkholderia dioscoreae]
MIALVVVLRGVALAAVRPVLMGLFMHVGMAVVPVGTGFRPFETVGFGVVGLTHGGFLVRFVV